MDILLTLVFLQIKHWHVDFCNQTDSEVQSKGIYGNLIGIGHSVKHGLLTYAIFLFMVPFNEALFIGIVDIVLHYHIDWIKMNYGNRDIQTKKFWCHLGLDQMAHQICYIGYIAFFAVV